MTLEPDSVGALSEDDRVDDLREVVSALTADADALSADSPLDQVAVTRISEANLPSRMGDDSRLIVYEERPAGAVHVALVLGEVRGKSRVVARMHSECLTGDVLLSKKCDCGSQLAESMDSIARSGLGVIVYLRNHEGRGIGLANKIRAYSLQDDGLDTVDANLALGLPVDGRSFVAGALILADLAMESIRLLTNNPRKIEAVRAAGVGIEEVVMIRPNPTEQNRDYLAVKRTRLGHRL